MLTRRILDVVADILTLLALAIAGAGHVLPWALIGVPETAAESQEGDTAAAQRRLADSGGRQPRRLTYMGTAHRYEPLPAELQAWHAARSGAALGLAALLVGASLVLNLGVKARKVLVLLMFVAVLAAIAFQILIYSPYPITEAHRSVEASDIYELEGFFVALVPSVIAGVLCLARMGWTMTASPKQSTPEFD